MNLSERQRRFLLSEESSIANKMHAVAEHWNRGYFVEHDWTGNVHKRARFRFEPEGKWHEAKDYLNDVVSKFDD